MATKRKSTSSHHPEINKSEKAKPMPSLIFNEGTLNESAETEEKQTEKFENIDVPTIPNPYNARASSLMWLGVICMTLVIFGLWSWSIAFRFSTVKWNKTPENNFYEATKQNWQNSFRTNDTSELTDKIKTSLTKIISNLPTTSSVTVASSTSSTEQ